MSEGPGHGSSGYFSKTQASNPIDLLSAMGTSPVGLVDGTVPGSKGP